MESQDSYVEVKEDVVMNGAGDEEDDEQVIDMPVI